MPPTLAPVVPTPVPTPIPTMATISSIPPVPPLQPVPGGGQVIILPTFQPFPVPVPGQAVTQPPIPAANILVPSQTAPTTFPPVSNLGELVLGPTTSSSGGRGDGEAYLPTPAVLNFISTNVQRPTFSGLRGGLPNRLPAAQTNPPTFEPFDATVPVLTVQPGLLMPTATEDVTPGFIAVPGNPAILPFVPAPVVPTNPPADGIVIELRPESVILVDEDGIVGEEDAVVVEESSIGDGTTTTEETPPPPPPPPPEEGGGDSAVEAQCLGGCNAEDANVCNSPICSGCEFCINQAIADEVVVVVDEVVEEVVDVVDEVVNEVVDVVDEVVDEVVVEQDISTIISDPNSDFQTLSQMFESGGITNEFAEPNGPFTLFGPNDAAFDALPPGMVDCLVLEENQEDMFQILANHFLADVYLSTDLEDGQTIQSGGGGELTVDLSNGVKINDANVVEADIVASNGAVHSIDSVLVPSNFDVNAFLESCGPGRRLLVRNF